MCTIGWCIGGFCSSTKLLMFWVLLATSFYCSFSLALDCSSLLHLILWWRLVLHWYSMESTLVCLVGILLNSRWTSWQLQWRYVLHVINVNCSQELCEDCNILDLFLSLTLTIFTIAVSDISTSSLCSCYFTLLPYCSSSHLLGWVLQSYLSLSPNNYLRVLCSFHWSFFFFCENVFKGNIRQTNRTKSS